jgi:hypothetical protein
MFPLHPSIILPLLLSVFLFSSGVSTFCCILNHTAAWMSGTERCAHRGTNVRSKWWQYCDWAWVWNGQEQQHCQWFQLFELNHSHLDRMPNLRSWTCGSSRGPWQVKPLVPVALVIPLQCCVFVNYQPSLFVFSNNNRWCSMSN